MNRRLIITLLLLTLLPLGLLGWLLIRLSRDEQLRLRDSVVQILDTQLQETAERIQAVPTERELQLLAVPDSTGTDREALRAYVRSTPAISGALLLDPKGRLLHPPADAPRSRQEQDFLVRAEQAWKDAALFLRPSADRPGGPAEAHGWYRWYHGTALRLLFWQRLADGRVLGLELDASRLLADVLERLPTESADRPASEAQSFVLQDSRGEVLYRWGGYVPGAREPPMARLTLAAPLASWQLLAFAPASAWTSSGGGLTLTLLLQLLPLALVLAGLGITLYRESTRLIREAQQRVSFVNHVSHELKTPLTNIRMYAELLKEAGEFDDPKSAQHLEVVVTESQRLSRLIDNVLSFARHQRGTLKLRLGEAVPDEVVGQVIESFQPVLAGRGVQVTFRPAAAQRVLLDADALGQILSNLLSNVEKYAASGGQVVVTTRQDGPRSVVTVADRGPGVPPGERDNVFKPFVRLGAGPSEGAAGTGIGLTIARELARLHGGDLRLLPSTNGATFEVTVAAQPVKG